MVTRVVTFSSRHGIEMISLWSAVEPVQWQGATIGVRIDVSSDSFVVISQFFNSIVFSCQIGGVEMINYLRIMNPVKRNRVGFLVREDIACGAFLVISKYGAGLLHFFLVCGVEVVVYCWIIRSQKRNGITRITTWFGGPCALAILETVIRTIENIASVISAVQAVINYPGMASCNILSNVYKKTTSRLAEDASGWITHIHVAAGAGLLLKNSILQDSS